MSAGLPAEVCVPYNTGAAAAVCRPPSAGTQESECHYTCPECFRAFSTTIGLPQHLTHAHPGVYNAIIDTARTKARWDPEETSGSQRGPYHSGDHITQGPYHAECDLASTDNKIGFVTVVRALNHIKCSTAKGLDGIQARRLKTLGKDAKDQLAEIFTDMLTGEADVPRDWRQGKVVLVTKKGVDNRLLRNYRPLTVTSTMYRVFATIGKERLRTWAERKETLTEPQGGFRHGRRLEDNVYTLTQCIEVARKKEKRLICCFLDVAKAYDSVPHDQLLTRLEQLDMPPQ